MNDADKANRKSKIENLGTKVLTYGYLGYNNRNPAVSLCIVRNRWKTVRRQEQK